MVRMSGVTIREIWSKSQFKLLWLSDYLIPGGSLFSWLYVVFWHRVYMCASMYIWVYKKYEREMIWRWCGGGSFLGMERVDLNPQARIACGGFSIDKIAWQSTIRQIEFEKRSSQFRYCIESQIKRINK